MMDIIIGLSKHVDFMIDSGAFTNHAASVKAAASGKKYDPITLDEYIGASKRLHGNVWQYVMLDKLNDPATSRANLAKMLDAGLKPMPVFVRGDAYSYAAELMKVNEYLCVGGVVDSKLDYSEQRLIKVSAATGGQAKLHGLGFVRFPSIFKVPLYSCDSSSWTSGGQYGKMTRFDPKTGLTQIPWSSMTEANGKTGFWLNYLLNCNIEPGVVYDRDAYRRHHGIPALVTTNSYCEFHKFATERGRKFFFACPNVPWFVNIVSVAATKAGQFFDYKLAAKHRAHLLAALSRKNPQAFVDEVGAILGRVTA